MKNLIYKIHNLYKSLLIKLIFLIYNYFNIISQI